MLLATMETNWNYYVKDTLSVGTKTGVTISQYHNYPQLILHIRIVLSYLHKALFTLFQVL